MLTGASQGGVLPPQTWAVPRAVVQGCRIALETVIVSGPLVLALPWERSFWAFSKGYRSNWEWNLNIQKCDFKRSAGFWLKVTHFADILGILGILHDAVFFITRVNPFRVYFHGFLVNAFAARKCNCIVQAWFAFSISVCAHALLSFFIITSFCSILSPQGRWWHWKRFSKKQTRVRT